MQEEVEHKTVNFAISTTNLTAHTFCVGCSFCCANMTSTLHRSISP